MPIVKRFVTRTAPVALASLAPVLAMTLAMVPTVASAAWSRAETAHFTVYSEGSDKSLREAAVDLERFDALLRKQFKVVADDAAHPLPIYLLDRAQAVSTLANRSFTAGYYSPAVGDTLAVSHREKADGQFRLDARQVLFHEYAHHFMMRHFPTAYPAWYIEGFAEFLSTVDFRADGRPEIGRPAYHRARGLIDGPSMPIRDLLFKQPRRFRGEMIDVYYGRSWLLVHMLANAPARAGQLASYLHAITSGMPQEQAAEQAFGDLDQLGRDLNAYRSKGLSYVRLNDPISAEIPVTITALDEGADAVVMPRLRRMRLIDAAEWGPTRARSGEKKDDDNSAPANARGAPDAAVAALDKELARLTAKWPHNADLLVELALVQRARDQGALALRTVDRAIAVQHDHGRARLLRGELLLVAAAEAERPTPAQWRDARAEIVRANRGAPNDPLPLLSYRRSFEIQGAEPPASALAGLARAFELAPESLELRGRFAVQLARQKRYAEAINVARTLASNPHDRGSGARLLDDVRTMARAGGYIEPGMTGEDKDAPDADSPPPPPAEP